MSISVASIVDAKPAQSGQRSAPREENREPVKPLPTMQRGKLIGWAWERALIPDKTVGYVSMAAQTPVDSWHKVSGSLKKGLKLISAAVVGFFADYPVDVFKAMAVTAILLVNKNADQKKILDRYF